MNEPNDHLVEPMLGLAVVHWQSDTLLFSGPVRTRLLLKARNRLRTFRLMKKHYGLARAAAFVRR
jgi:hypothetical protein